MQKCNSKKNYFQSLINESFCKMLNKSDLLYESMLELIHSGKLKPGDKFPSEYELADKYNVNKTTANKVVARLVSAGFLRRTRGRGGTIVAGMVDSPKGVIAYRLPILSAGTFSSQLLKGAQAAARAANYDLKYFEFEFPENEQWMQISRSGICGTLFSACVPPPSAFPFPAFCVAHDMGNHFVTSDNFDGGRQAAELFLANGHRHVAIISDKTLDKRNGRVGGFIQTMINNGMPHPEKLFFPIPQNNEINIHTLWESISSAKEKITGAFCYSDTIAIHLLLHLNSLGIKVPQDFSICGFGNMQTVNTIMPLTTIRQFPETIGFTACTKLIELIEKSAVDPIEIYSPVELINPRHTVGQAKSMR